MRMPTTSTQAAAERDNRRAAEPLASTLTTHATVERLVGMVPGTDPLSVEANYMVVRAFGALAGAMDGYLAEWGLTPARMTLLRVLHEAPEHRLTMGQIRSRLNVTSTNVSKLVAGLERRGWVRRVAGDADRRVVHAELTDSGNRQFQERLPGMLQQMEDFWAEFNAAEKTTVIEAMRKLWFSVQAGPARAAAPAPSTED